MSEYLPDDLIIKILERLPVRSLIRFSFVCKSWYTVIRSPSFITQHLYRVNSPDQIVENEKIVFGASFAGGKMVGLYSLNCDNSCYSHLKLDVSYGSGLRNVEIVGTCSGLVCLQLMLTKKNGTYAVDRVVVWNPSIRKSVSILCTQSSLSRRMFYGFFVHPTTHEFKVLAVHSGGDNGAPYHAEIYRQHTGAWTAIHCVLPHLVNCFLSQASVNGLVYWLRTDWGDFIRPCLNSIALFNMHTEDFSEVTLPPSLVHAEPGHLCFMFSHESLILYEMELECGDDTSGYSIWFMKEHGISESWCKLFNVKMPMAWLTPLGLRMNGELLSTTRAGDSLVCHDHVTNKTTTIAIEAHIRHMVAGTYVESLLLLNANAASEHESFGEFLSD